MGGDLWLCTGRSIHVCLRQDKGCVAAVTCGNVLKLCVDGEEKEGEGRGGWVDRWVGRRGGDSFIIQIKIWNVARIRKIVSEPGHHERCRARRCLSWAGRSISSAMWS